MACKKQNNSFKRNMCGVVMKLLGKGICYAYKVDSRVKEDLDKICGYTEKDGESVANDFAVKIAINPIGPCMVFGKKDGKVFSNKCDFDEKADILLSFKGVNSAFKMFTGRLGLGDGYAQHRFTVNGDLYKVLGIVRIMNIVESYLFPKFIAKKLMNPVPPKQVNSVRFLCGTLF